MTQTVLEPIILDVDFYDEEYELELDPSFEEYDTDIEESIKIVDGDSYTGPYIVVPKTAQSTILATRNKTMRDDVTVLEIPYAEVSNPIGGKTAIIGGI